MSLADGRIQPIDLPGGFTGGGRSNSCPGGTTIGSTATTAVPATTVVGHLLQVDWSQLINKSPRTKSDLLETRVGN